MKLPILLRLAIPAIVGAGVTLLCAFGATMDWPVSIILGAVTWVGLGVFSYRRDPFKALKRQRGLPIEASVIRDELATARQRLDRINAAVLQLRDKDLTASFNEILGTAHAIANEVLDDPRDYPRIRKVMVYYLEHTTMIAEGLAQLPPAHAGSAEALARAKETLPQIATTFRQYRDKLAENEAFDVETRLTLLERDLQRASAKTGPKKSQN